MTNREDEALYNAEQQAFEGTPLADYFSRTSLMLETLEIVNRVNHLTGDVKVRESSVKMVNHAAYAQGQTITFAPNDLPRYVAVHEVSHVVHRRSGLGGRAHGPEYRSVYAEMVEIAYGSNYARLLREAYQQLAMDINSATLPKLAEPIIDLEVLTDVSRGVRWL